MGLAEVLAAATADQNLEGIVAKRVYEPWTPGRRSPTWVKTKHRRWETLVVTGWREHAHTPAEFLLARPQPGRHVGAAGSVALGVDGDTRTSLIDLLSAHELPRRRRRDIRWTAARVEVVVDAHGRPDGPVRDAILRGVVGLHVA